MLPIAYTLLTECLPAKQRGWAVVLVGALGLIGGYFAASGCAALFEPYFGWRIMWFLNAPTGIVLILCNNLIPESPRFLVARGRIGEARALVKRYAVAFDPTRTARAVVRAAAAHSGALMRPPFRGTTFSLNLAGVAWGLVNFGLLLWLPAELRDRGYSISGSDALLFRSALLALPTTVIVAWLYSRWSTKWTLFVLTIVTAIGLVSMSLADRVPALDNHLILLLSALMIGVNGIIAVLLPYSSESYPVLLRGRATGLVAGSSKLGGLAAQGLTVAALVPSFGLAAFAMAFPIAVSAAMVAVYGHETRQRTLE